jgi:hypothetical protein
MQESLTIMVQQFVQRFGPGAVQDALEKIKT